MLDAFEDDVIHILTKRISLSGKGFLDKFSLSTEFYCNQLWIILTITFQIHDCDTDYDMKNLNIL